MLEEAGAKLGSLQQQLEGMSPSPRMSQIIREGDYLYRVGDYATSFFTIVEGEVVIESESGEVLRTLSRGEFFSAYTPYQPEAAQGTLQSIFEFQTIVAELFGMEKWAEIDNKP